MVDLACRAHLRSAKETLLDATGNAAPRQRAISA
jgi:hypothetical protein